MSAGWVRSGATGLAALLIGLTIALAGVMVAPTDEASGYIDPGGNGVNGNQELLADPGRPLIYYADPLGSDLTILDTETDETWTLDVGTAPRSVDIDPVSQLLYISVSGMNKTVVVDTVVKQVGSEITLDFSPLSLSIGSEDRLYVSSAYDDFVRVIDVTTGEVLDTHDLPGMRILEVSPGGDQIIGASMGTDPVRISRYDIVGNSLHLAATDGLDLGSNFRQMVPDWENDRLYLASGAPYGLEVLSIATLDKIEFLQMEAYPTAVALANDSSVVVGLSTDLYEGRLFMFNTTTGDLVGQADAPLSGDSCALTCNLQYAFLGPDLHRVRVDSAAVPQSPDNGSVLGYSPSYVSFVIEQGIVRYEPVQFLITVDGTDHTAYLTENYRYLVSFAGPLGLGSHEVNVSVESLTTVKQYSWSFSIDPGSEDAIRPSIASVNPPFGADLEMTGFLRIDVSVDLPDPEPLYHEVAISVDGEWLLTELNLEEEGLVYSAVTSDLLPGTHDATAFLSWDLGNVSYAWPFAWRIWPSITPSYPIGQDLVPYGIDNITFRVDFGEPAAELVDLTVLLDGANVSNLLHFTDDSVEIFVATPFSPGIHDVYVKMVTDVGMITEFWFFEVVSIPSMSKHTHPNGFSILAPITWDVTLDEELGGDIVDVVMRGPIYYDFLTNVLVFTSTNPLVEESTEFLQLQYDYSLEGIEREGIPVTVVDGPHYFELANHSAMEFTVEWDQEDIKQRLVAVADEDRELLLVITCSSAKGSYPGLAPIFDAIVNSLEIEPLEGDEPEPPGDDLEFAKYALLVGIVAVSATCALVLIAMRRRKRPEGLAPVREQQAPWTRSFCQWCGGKAAESDVVCPSCGRSLLLETDSEKTDLDR